MASAKTYNEVDCKQQLLYIEIEKGEYGGYRQDLLANSLSEVEIDFYICTKCNGLLRNACMVGIDQSLACETCVVEGEAFQPMVKSRKKIPELGAKCPLSSRKCVWKGIIGEVEAHLDECTELVVNCFNKCSVILKRSELMNHCGNECLNRKVNCMHCKIIFQYKEIDNHLTTCPELPLLCINECMETFLRKEMNSHIEKDCPNTIVNCMNGCGLTMKRRKVSIHCGNECQHRRVNCMHCKVVMLYKGIDNHFTTCPELPILCPNECMETLPRKEMNSHIEKDCPNTIVSCPNSCEVIMKRVKLLTHCENECLHRIVNCEYCGATLLQKELENHYKSCLEFPLFCPNKCQRSLKRKELESHIEEECPNTFVACPYKEMGCDVLTKRCEIKQHEKLFESNHLEITVIYYSDKVKSMETLFKDKDMELENMETLFKGKERELNSMETHFKDKERELENMETLFNDKGRELENMETLSKDKDMEIDILTSTVKTVEAQMSEEERINERLTEEVMTLKNWLLTEIKSKLIYKNSRFNEKPEMFSKRKQFLEVRLC